MGFQFGGTQANVSITGSPNIPTGGTTQTIIAGTATINSATTTTLRTVTAGKTFYLSGIHISCPDGSNGGVLNFRNDGTTFSLGKYGSATSQPPSSQFVPYPTLPFLATKVFDVISTSISGTVYVNYTGFEQ